MSLWSGRGEREGTQLQLVAGGRSQGQPNYEVRPFVGWGVGKKKGAQWARQPKRRSKARPSPSFPLRLPVLLAKACQWPGDNQQEKGE